MPVWSLSRFRRKQTPVETMVEVQLYGRGSQRYEARPLTMLVRGKEIDFNPSLLAGYGRTRWAARRRCLGNVKAYLKERGKGRDH